MKKKKKKEYELLTIVVYTRLLNDMYMNDMYIKTVANAYIYERLRVGVIYRKKYFFFRCMGYFVSISIQLWMASIFTYIFGIYIPNWLIIFVFRKQFLVFNTLFLHYSLFGYLSNTIKSLMGVSIEFWHIIHIWVEWLFKTHSEFRLSDAQHVQNLYSV